MKLFINLFIDKIRNLKLEVKTLQKRLQNQEQKHTETTTDLRQTKTPSYVLSYCTIAPTLRITNEGEHTLIKNYHNKTMKYT